MKTRVLKDGLRRITSMLLTTAITVCAVASYPANALAANNNKYISDVILYDGSVSGSQVSKEALEGEGYTFLKEDIYDNVSLGYKVTDKKEDAIRDIALLGMDDKFRAGYFDEIVAEKEETTLEFVKGLMTLVEEYRSNYKAGKERALEAYDRLNRFYEDDTGLKMGDFFLDESIEESQYVTLFMQSNVRTLDAMEKVLAGASDTKDNTWVDRLLEYGSLETMIIQMVEDDENYPDVIDEYSALAYMEEQYLTDAQSIYNIWDSYSDILNKYKDCQYHLTDGDAWLNYLAELNGTEDGQLEALELQKAASLYDSLQVVEYGSSGDEYNEYMDTDEDGENTLLDLFLKNTKDGTLDVVELYPLVAALSPGQIFAATCAGIEPLLGAAGEQCQDKISEGDIEIEMEDAVGVEDAVEADDAVEVEDVVVVEEVEKLNDKVQEQQDKLLEIVDQQVETFAKEHKDIAEEVLDEEGAVSVYAGVDRSFYEGGVAVTSRTYNSVNAGKDFSDENVEKDVDVWKLISNICAGLSITTFIAGAIMTGIIAPLRTVTINLTWEQEVDNMINSALEELGEVSTTQATTQATTIHSAFGVTGAVFMAVGVVLLIAGIISFLISETKSKDHTKYLDIPLKIADMSAGKPGMNPYLFYNAVLNQDGKAQDIYRWQEKQWLVMYTTKSTDAGTPILETDFCKRVDLSEGVDAATYTGIHKFESSGANLINIKKVEEGKTATQYKYYFRHATKEDMAASVFSDNGLLISMLCLAVGAFGGFFVGNARKREEVA